MSDVAATAPRMTRSMAKAVNGTRKYSSSYDKLPPVHVELTRQPFLTSVIIAAEPVKDTRSTRAKTTSKKDAKASVTPGGVTMPTPFNLFSKKASRSH